LDIVPYLGTLRMVPCARGQAFSIPSGLIPFGREDSFLSEEPSSHQGTAALSFSRVLDATDQVESSHLCFALESEATYVDPLGDFFPDSQVQRGLELMFSVESLGLPEQESFSDIDQEKVRVFQESIILKDNKYYVELPWHMDKLSRVRSNHAISIRILDRVVRRLKKEGVYQQYLEVFHEQERDGTIEEIKVLPDQFEDYTWIPHRPVFKTDPTSTTKIRPVFNCSLKIGDSVSLNEAAYPGINLTSSMLNLLLSFRSNKHVLLADIKKAFLMIRLRLESDKNRFCFFLRDGDQLRCYRYTTIIFGFVSSPFILGCILKFHAARFPQDRCRSMMEERFYVDNLVMSDADPDVLTELYSTCRVRLQQGGFELRACNSNCNSLRDQMSRDGTLSTHGSRWEKVLGYCYAPLTEEMSVTPVKCDPCASTKRRILAEAAKVFDPLSLCLPVTLRGRVLVAKLWKEGLNWDEQIPDRFLPLWKALAQDLSGLSDVMFGRSVFQGGQGELFIFCDASTEAYGFAAYVVQHRHPRLVFAKAKVAPLKAKTLPTLELMAIYLALKCLPTILDGCKSLIATRLYVATDAQVVLSWILSQSMASKSIFARNRLKDVLQMKDQIAARYGLETNFRYIHTSQNPADLITRGMSLKRFKSVFNFWFSGPSWMEGGGTAWPVQNLSCLSRNSQQLASASVSVSMALEADCTPCVDFGRFSDFSFLLRVMTLVFLFINKLRGRSEEVGRKAMVFVIRTIQSQSYGTELDFLRNPARKLMPPLVHSLDLFLDQDSLIRSRGRMDKTPHLSFEVKNPILLGKGHLVTRLIIMDCHSRSAHLGVGSTLAELRRSGFWIPQGRQAVTKTLASCHLCRRYNSRPVLPSNSASLPVSRVEFTEPFKNTGVDFTGHFWIRRGSAEEKVYLLLFTCMAIRAIHVEVVPDMSMLSFVQALVRFTNLYGVPQTLYSDNARTFVGGGKLFTRLALFHEYQVRFASSNIKLRTIPLFSPWYGGVWERCIQTVKTCMYKTIGRGRVDYFSLLTIVSDVQRAVNNRPLTYWEFADRGLEAITPSMFLGLSKNTGLILRLQTDDLSTSAPPGRRKLVEAMERRNRWLEDFRRRWYEEYLLCLRERPQGRSQEPFLNRLKLNDIVLIKSPLKPRPFWILGSILELIRSDEDIIRSARVRQSDGAVVIHSLKHLYPLELSVSPEATEATGATAAPTSPPNVSNSLLEEEAAGLWLCPICNSAQGDENMIACDHCDEWFHFRCAGVEKVPPRRQKWYCAECAPRKRRRGRPSLLPG